MACKVVNVKQTESWTVYIGRPGILGNPFVIGQHGDRAQCIELFKHYAVRRAKIDEKFKTALLACEDQVLGCHCAPSDCHGDEFDEIIAYVKAHVPMNTGKAN